MSITDPVNAPGLSSSAGLGAFFAALAGLEKKQSTGPVRILQIGDSHTANDAFSGRMREALQGRFGAAGRGWLPAGIPFTYYRPRLVVVRAAGWRHLRTSEGAPAEAIGIDGTVAQSRHADAWMTLASSESDGFSRLAIEHLAQPYGGTLSIRVDRQDPIEISTAASGFRAVRRAITVRGQAHRVELRAIGGNPVYVIGWTAEHDRAGIIYENHGMIGATVGLLGGMSPATVAHELWDSRPALLVIAFGTNEGFDASLDLAAYRESFLARVDALRRNARHAAVLVLGPPDGNEIAPSGPGPAGSPSWREPRTLAAVRGIQRTVAADKGWAFWDWSQAMGGTGSMHRLVMRDPPLALPDHVHLNQAGYAATADALFVDLITEYQRWKSGRRGD